MDRKEEAIAELRALIAQQVAQLAAQAARIAELELALAKAQKNSATSSKPPSSDLTNPPPKHHRPGRRPKPHPSTQPGHARHLRGPLPPERVDASQDHEIQEDAIRWLHLTPTGAYESVQHIELPETPMWVTEHRLAGYRSPAGELYLPDVSELKGPLFGPRLVTMIGWRKSVGHLSYSAIEAWREDVLHVPVSRGDLAQLCTRPIAAALAAPNEEPVALTSNKSVTA